MRRTDAVLDPNSKVYVDPLANEKVRIDDYAAKVEEELGLLDEDWR